MFAYDTIHSFVVDYGDFLRWSLVLCLLLACFVGTVASVLLSRLRKSSLASVVVAVLGFTICMKVAANKPNTNSTDQAGLRAIFLSSLAQSATPCCETDSLRLRATSLAIVSNRMDVGVCWDLSDDIGLIAYRTASSLSPADWSSFGCVTNFTGMTNHTWSLCRTGFPFSASGFVQFEGHSLSGDADGDGVTNGRELSLGTDPFSAHSDADWLTDGEELGKAESVFGDGFVWFEVSNGFNYVRQSTSSLYYWSTLEVPLVVGSVANWGVMMNLDGLCHLLPTAYWRDYLEKPWSGTNNLHKTDFSGGYVSVLPFGADLWGQQGRSGMYVETVCTNGVTYEVMEWKNMRVASGVWGGEGTATFEVIIPSDETNVLYVSYLDVDAAVALANPVCGVQDSSQRSAVDGDSYYAIPAPCSPRNRTTVRYVFGENSDPRVEDPEWMYYGQCDDWVRSNFTNSEEILSVGYTNWVDESVGCGRTNGLYKLTAHVTGIPPDRASFSVGDLKVNFDDSEEYVFLLEKGRRYDLSVSPGSFTNIVFSAVDDIGLANHDSFLSASPGFQDGYWTEDRRGLVLQQVGWNRFGYVIYYPTLYVTPGNWQPTEINPTMRFFAVVTDIAESELPTYSWSTSDPSAVSISWSSTSSAVITAHYPAAATTQVDLSLTVRLSGGEMSVHYAYGTVNPESRVRMWVEIPNVLFVNNDDDDGENGEDYDSPQDYDDDIVCATIHLESDVQTNGTIRLEQVSGFYGDVFSSLGPIETIQQGHSWPVSVMPGVDKKTFVYVNPYFISRNNGAEIRFRWIPESGYSLDARAVFSVVEPVVEPICSEIKSVTLEGCLRNFVYNPCGIGIGERAYFKVGVSPSAFPDSAIEWTANNRNVRFLGGNTGREVCVVGVNPGVVELTVGIRDGNLGNPIFKARVVEMSEVNVTCLVAKGADGEPIRTTEEIDEMIRGANEILLQVGVQMKRTADPRVIEISHDGMIARNEDSVVEDMVTFSNLVDVASNTGGVEVYFVRSIRSDSNKNAITGLHCDRGIALEKLADALVLAHEVGHAIGMSDIYVAEGDYRLTYGETRKIFMDNDWNGGCQGPSDFSVHYDVMQAVGSARYFRRGLLHGNVIQRLLMNGERDFDSSVNGIDITYGTVYGMDTESIDGLVDCGCFYGVGRQKTRSPVHR